MRPPDLSGYRVGSLLGAGGLGSVWEAWRESDGRPVAFKAAHSGLEAHARERFRRECEAMLRLGPPHVPELVQAGQLADERPYIVMERITAPTLAAFLAARREPPEPAAAAAIADAILACLEVVHARGLVHRDLKPANVFIDAGPPARAKLIDFGLVTNGGPPAAGSRCGLTRPGAVVGSAGYMSPEQLAGGEVDERTDIYAAGVILYELLTLRPPFEGERVAVEHGHRLLRPPRPSTLAPVPPAAEEVVLRCLAKDPGERLPSASALRAAFTRAMSLPVASVAAPPAPRAAGAPGATRVPVALVFLDGADDAAAVQAELEARRGRLVHSRGDRHVGAFPYDACDRPVQAARAAAHALVDRGLCARAAVDVAEVTAKLLPGGKQWFASPLFARADRFPGPGDPPGVKIAAGATDTPAPLVGRDAHLAALLAGARHAVDERAPAVTAVLAEPGMGKSRLFAEVAERLRREPGARVLDIRIREGGAADEAIRELLRQALRLHGEPTPDTCRAALAARLGAAAAGEHWPALAATLGWASPDDPALRDLRAAPGVLRSSAARAAGEVLAREGAPLFVIVDDAHWADDVTLDALEYAALAEGGAPIWVAVFARPSFARLRPHWGDRAATRSSLELGPLDRDSARVLCRELLGSVDELPEVVLDHIVERAHAVPLWLVELAAGLGREGLIRPPTEGTSAYVVTELLDRLPDTPLVQWVARRELDALLPELAAHARLAALLGHELTARELAGVVGELDRSGHPAGSSVDARAGLEQLARAGLLLARGDGSYAFRHALLRDAIAVDPPPELRRRVHEAALAWYRSAGDLDERLRLPRLADHAARAGAHDEAARAYAALAERARARHAYLDAERAYSALLDELAGDDDGARGRVHHERGVMRYRLSRFDDALADLRIAGEIARRRGDPAAEAEILLDEAMALDWLEDFPRSRAATARAQELAARLDDPALAARLLMSLGRSAHRFSENAEAARLFEQAVARAEALDAGSGYETIVISLALLGYVYAGLGRLADAEAAFERVIPMCRERGDLMHLAAALNNRYLLWTCRNDRTRLMADFDEIHRIGRVTGLGAIERCSDVSRAYVLYSAGELDAARTYALRGMAVDRRRHGEEARPEAALLLARIDMAAGDAPAARALLSEIRAGQRRARAEGWAAALLSPSEEVLLDMVDLATGESTAEAWDALLVRAERFSVEQERNEILQARGLRFA